MKRDPNYILRRTTDSIVIVPVGRAAFEFSGMIIVNETGALLWELLEQERTETELVESLYAQFEAEPAQIAADVSTFLRRLRMAGALTDKSAVSSCNNDQPCAGPTG